MIRGCWALIPLKAATEAKSRLSDILGAHQRADLQRSMLGDLLEGLRTSTLLSGVALYGPDAATACFAHDDGLFILKEPEGIGGLNEAVADGATRLAAMGAKIIAVLPGDLPLAEGEELDRALSDVALSGDCAVVPDRWQEGTNSLIFPARRPPAFRFGPGSFWAHLAGVAGLDACPRRAIHLPSFANDVDTPGDLTSVCQTIRQDRGRRIKAFLRDALPQRVASCKETRT